MQSDALHKYDACRLCRSPRFMHDDDTGTGTTAKLVFNCPGFSPHPTGWLYISRDHLNRFYGLSIADVPAELAEEEAR